MANTYTQLHTQLIFAVKNRECQLPNHADELHRYINGIVKNVKGKPIAVNNMPDHIHIFLTQHPDISVSQLVQKIKTNTSRWIKGKYNLPSFAWQTGYAAFSYGHSQIEDVKQYVINQQVKHQRRSFKEEYLGFLDKFGIDYNDVYLFDFFE